MVSAYGSVRCASQAICRSRSVSGKSMPSGPVTSRPCAQCSASRVVASVAGFTGPATHVSGCCGSAARSASSAARRARRQRAKTCAGAARSARTISSARSSTVLTVPPDPPDPPDPPAPPAPADPPDPPAMVERRSAPAALATTPSSDCARWSTTSATVHPAAPDSDRHSASLSPLRMASSRSSSAARSSKTVTPETMAQPGPDPLRARCAGRPRASLVDALFAPVFAANPLTPSPANRACQPYRTQRTGTSRKIKACRKKRRRSSAPFLPQGPDFPHGERRHAGRKG